MVVADREHKLLLLKKKLLLLKLKRNSLQHPWWSCWAQPVFLAGKQEEFYWMAVSTFFFDSNLSCISILLPISSTCFARQKAWPAAMQASSVFCIWKAVHFTMTHVSPLPRPIFFSFFFSDAKVWRPWFFLKIYRMVPRVCDALLSFMKDDLMRQSTRRERLEDGERLAIALSLAMFISRLH